MINLAGGTNFVKYDVLDPLPEEDQGGLDARNPNQGIRMFRHGSRSFSRHIVCRSEVCAAMSQARTS